MSTLPSDSRFAFRAGDRQVFFDNDAQTDALTLYGTDGTSGDAETIFDGSRYYNDYGAPIQGFSYSNSFAGYSFFYTSTSHTLPNGKGSELFATDGTEAGTVPLFNVGFEGDAAYLTSDASGSFYAANVNYGTTETEYTALYFTDGKSVTDLFDNLDRPPFGSFVQYRGTIKGNPVFVVEPSFSSGSEPITPKYYEVTGTQLTALSGTPDLAYWRGGNYPWAYANWSTGVPTASTDVTIAGDVPSTVIVDDHEVAHSVYLGPNYTTSSEAAASLEIIGGSLTVTDAVILADYPTDDARQHGSGLYLQGVLTVGGGLRLGTNDPLIVFDSTINGNIINNSNIFFEPAANVTINGNITGADGNIHLQDGDKLTLNGAVDRTQFIDMDGGEVDVGSSGSLLAAIYFQGGEVIDNSGSLTLYDVAFRYGDPSLVKNEGHLTFSDYYRGGTGNLFSSSTSLMNAGTIEASGFGFFHVNASLTGMSGGTIITNDSTDLEFDGATNYFQFQTIKGSNDLYLGGGGYSKFDSTSTIEVPSFNIAGAGTTVELDNVSNLPVDPVSGWFTISMQGNADVLKLKGSSGQQGNEPNILAVNLFKAGDTVDFEDVPYKASDRVNFYNNDALIYDSATYQEVRRLEFFGDFSNSFFSVSSDGKGGTLLSVATAKTVVTTLPDGSTQTSTYVDGQLVRNRIEGITGEVYTASDEVLSDNKPVSTTYSGVTGKPYTAFVSAYGPDGKVSSNTYTTDAGATYAVQTFASDGSSTISHPGITGPDYTNNYAADGTQTGFTQGGITGKPYTSTTDTFAPGTQHTATKTFTRADGSTYAVLTRTADGGTALTHPGISGKPYTAVTDLHDASGALVGRTYSGFTGKPYTSTTDSYGPGSSLPVSSTATRADGSVYSVYTVGPDGNSVVAHPDVIGQAYTGLTNTYTPAGTLLGSSATGYAGSFDTKDTSFAASGTPLFTALTKGGSVVETVSYDASGKAVVTTAYPAAGGQAVANAGLFVKAGTADGWAVDTAFANTGTVRVASGSVAFTQGVTNDGSIDVGPYSRVTAGGMLTGSGTVDVHGAESVFEVGGASTNTVAFSDGTAATLRLDDPGSFAGAIRGFGSQSLIDVQGFSGMATLGYTANATDTGGTLTIEDAGRQASLQLTGHYTLGDFAKPTVDQSQSGILVRHA